MMIEDKDNGQPPPTDDVERMDVVERALIAVLRAPISADADAFDARVMAAVRRERAHCIAVSKRRYARVFGVAAAGGALAAYALFLIINGGIPDAAREVPATPVAVAPMSHTVRFTLVASGASRVTLAGSFNGWNTASTPLRRVGNDTWAADIPLGAGRYVYQFVIDGTRWVTDPRAPRDAGGDFGATNSVVTVPTSGSA